MKKNELVHLHALLIRVAEDYVERGEATRADFDEYHELELTPTSLREPRMRHEEAVRVLARILSDRSGVEGRVSEAELTSR